MATFGQDNTDSNISGPKFYLGKITGQSNIGARDSLGNPIPYYSKDDIGTIQSSAMLQDFHESEFKKAQFSPNTPWITYINTLSDTTSLVIIPGLIEVADFSWGLGANDRETELNFLNKLLSYKGTMVDLSALGGPIVPFGDLYRSKIKNIFEVANPAIPPLMPDTATMWEMIEGLASTEPPYSTLETQTSVETRFPRVTTDNLYEAVNQIIANTYDMQRDMIYNKNYGDLTSVFYQVSDVKRNVDDIIGDIFDGPGGSVFQTLNLAPIGYANLTSGVIGNYNLIQNLNLTGIGGFPTDYISGQFLQANDNGLEFVTIEDPVFEFTGLSDTPSSITPLKYVRGNQLGDALEFGGINFLSDVDDRPTNPLTSGYLQLTDQNTLIWSAIPTGGGTTNYNFTGSEYFTGLKDTPNNYDLNKFIRSTNAGLEYVDINGGVVSFLGLSGTPSNFTADKYLKINSSANAVEYADIPSPSVDFTGLLDTPIDYTNASNKYLRVNSTSNGIEFIDISGQIATEQLDWDNYLRFGDLPSPSDHRGMLAYVHIDEGGGDSGALYFSRGNAWVQFFPWVPNIGFSGLTDTPNDYAGQSGKYLKVSDNESGLEYTNLPDPVVDFTGLTDTPTSFAGQSKKYLQVNSAEDSLEFVDPLFSTGSFVGFGGAVVFKGLENTTPVDGWNDRQITSLQGYSGIKGVTLNNNQITLPGGKYLIDAEGGVFRSEATRIGIEFTAGDYAGQLFESRSNYAGTAVGNREGGARGSVKAVVQSNNPMTFKVRSFISDAASVTTFQYAHTDVSILDLGGDRDVLSITGLYDTPNSFDGASGKFIQINDNEDGVKYSSLSGQISSQEIDWLAYSTVSDLPSASDHHGMFAHVHSEGAAYMAHAGNWEKIYPVNGGSLTFTGLSDTPNVYDDGKILQSTANGLEWVDMPSGGGGSTGGNFNGGAGSKTLVKQSNNFYTNLPDAILAFDELNDLERVLYLTHYGEYYDGINYQNNTAQHNYTLIFNHLTPSGELTNNSQNIRVLYDSLSGYVANDRAIYFGGGSGGSDGSSNYEFCKAFAAAGQTFSHQLNGQTKVNLDTNNLTQESQNWLHTDTTLNVVGIKIPEDGLYNINTNLNPSRNPLTQWQQDVLNLNKRLLVLKANGTTEELAHSTEAKTASSVMSNGALLTVDFSLDNVDLQQGDFIYMETSAWLTQNETQQHGIDENLSYISVSKSSGGGGGGGSSTFAGLTDTPSTLTEGSGQYLKVSDDGQTIEYVDLPAGGGVGSLDALQNFSNLYTNYPDSIYVEYTAGTKINLIFSFFNQIADIAYYRSTVVVNDTNMVEARFTNDASGTLLGVYKENNGSMQTHYTAANAEFQSLSGYITGGRAVYNGGFGSSSVDTGSPPSNGEVSGGIGENQKINSHSNFYQNIPDKLITSNATQDFVIYDFSVVTTDQIIYTQIGNDSNSYTFDNDLSGTYDSNTVPSHIGDQSSTSLSGFIEQNRGVYLGGSPSSNGGSALNNVLSARIAADGTIVDQNPTWIESCVKHPNILGYYTITYKTNYFTKIPSVVATADLKDNVSHMVVEYNNPTKDSIIIQTRKNNDAAEDTDFTIIAHNVDVEGGGSSSTFSASSYQENILQGHLTTNNDANLSDLHFTGLETGAYYRLGGQVRFIAGFDNAGTDMWLYAYQDSFATDNIVAALNNRPGGDGDPVNATHTFNHIFQATGDLFFALGGMNSSQDRYIYGNGTKQQTYLQLEKL